jgi:hypothetical protein
MIELTNFECCVLRRVSLKVTNILNLQKPGFFANHVAGEIVKFFESNKILEQLGVSRDVDESTLVVVYKFLSALMSLRKMKNTKQLLQVFNNASSSKMLLEVLSIARLEIQRSYGRPVEDVGPDVMCCVTATERIRSLLRVLNMPEGIADKLVPPATVVAPFHK